MHAVSTNHIANILHFNDKMIIYQKSELSKDLQNNDYT